MISIYHLIWIVPVSFCLGVLAWAWLVESYGPGAIPPPPCKSQKKGGDIGY